MSTNDVSVPTQLRSAGVSIAEAVASVKLRDNTNPGIPLEIKEDVRLKPGCVRNGIEKLRDARRLLEVISPPVNLKTFLNASLAEIQRAIDGLHPLSVCVEWLEKGGDPSFRGFWHNGPEYQSILGDTSDEYIDEIFPEHNLIKLVEAADRWLCDHGPALLERRAGLDHAASMLEAGRTLAGSDSTITKKELVTKFCEMRRCGRNNGGNIVKRAVDRGDLEEVSPGVFTLESSERFLENPPPMRNRDANDFDPLEVE